MEAKLSNKDRARRAANLAFWGWIAILALGLAVETTRFCSIVFVLITFGLYYFIRHKQLRATVETAAIVKKGDA